MLCKHVVQLNFRPHLRATRMWKHVDKPLDNPVSTLSFLNVRRDSNLRKVQIANFYKTNLHCKSDFRPIHRNTNVDITYEHYGLVTRAANSGWLFIQIHLRSL